MNVWTIDEGEYLKQWENREEMSSSSKRQVSNGDLEPTEKIRHLNTALIVSTKSEKFVNWLSD